MAGRPRTRSSEPVPGNFRHGTGYAYDTKKCGCDVCTAYNADKKRKSRGEAPVAPEVAATCQRGQAMGKFEQAARAFIAEVNATGAEAELLADMMVFNAQMLDSIPGNGRWHLANSAQKAMHECREELHKLAGGSKPQPDAGSDLQGFLNGLTQQG